MARCMTMAGVRPGMLVHNANTYGLFTGGHGFHQGAERIGATGPPGVGRLHGAAGAAPPRPRRAGAGRDALVRARDRAGRARRRHRPGRAEARARPVRRRALDRGAARADRARASGPAARSTSTGCSEMCGPGVAAECLEARDGLHVHEDHFLVEVVDPESGEPLGEGDEGELVFTTLRQGGDAAAPLPHRRHRLAHLRAVRAAAGRRRGSGACGAGATT